MGDPGDIGDEWRDGAAIIIGNRDWRPGFREQRGGVLADRDPGDEHDDDRMRWMTFTTAPGVVSNRHVMPSPEPHHDPGDEDHVEIIGDWWIVRGEPLFVARVVS
jgi:hypothetical protein